MALTNAAPVETKTAETATITFDGIIESSSGRVFVISHRKSAREVSARSWLSIGQSFSGFVLESFNPQDESVVLMGPTKARTRIKLKEAKVLSSDTNTMEYVAAYERANKAVDEALIGIRKKWDAPVGLSFDLDGSTMPEDVRQRFVLQREQEEKKGGTLVGILVNGNWVFSPYRGEASQVIPKILSEPDRRMFEAAWILVHAEGMARATASKKL